MSPVLSRQSMEEKKRSLSDFSMTLSRSIQENKSINETNVNTEY